MIALLGAVCIEQDFAVELELVEVLSSFLELGSKRNQTGAREVLLVDVARPRWWTPPFLALAFGLRILALLGET